MSKSIAIIGAGIAGLAAGCYGQMMRGKKSMDKTVPGLDNFYMAGQWVQPGGGVPTAAESARSAIEMLCKQDGVSFATKTP